MKKGHLEITEKDTETEPGYPWQAVRFNDEVHTFGEAILWIWKAARRSFTAACGARTSLFDKPEAVSFPLKFDF